MDHYYLYRIFAVVMIALIIKNDAFVANIFFGTYNGIVIDGKYDNETITKFLSQQTSVSRKHFIMLLTDNSELQQIRLKKDPRFFKFEFGVEVIWSLCLSDGSSILVIDIGSHKFGSSIDINRALKFYRIQENQIIDICTSRVVFGN